MRVSLVVAVLLASACGSPAATPIDAPPDVAPDVGEDAPLPTCTELSVGDDIGLADANTGNQTGIVTTTNGDVFFVAWYEVRSGQPRIVGARKTKTGEWIDTSVIDLASAANASGPLSVAWSGIYFVVSWVDVAPPAVRAVRVASDGTIVDAAPVTLVDGVSKALFDCRSSSCALLAGDEQMVRTLDAFLTAGSTVPISVSGVTELRIVGADIVLGYSEAGVPTVIKAGAPSPETFADQTATLHAIAAAGGAAKIVWYTPSVPGPRQSFLSSLPPVGTAPIELPNFVSLALGPLGDGTLVALRQTNLIARRYADATTPDVTLHPGVTSGLTVAGAADAALVAWTADMRLHARVVTCAN